MGDLNVAHTQLDIANPNGNKHRAGFTEQERESFDKLLKDGWVDTFRQKHPQTKAFSFFTSRVAGMKEKNVGWRLDYVLACERAAKAVTESKILKSVDGSDHVPVEITLDLGRLD